MNERGVSLVRRDKNLQCAEEIVVSELERDPGVIDILIRWAVSRIRLLTNSPSVARDMSYSAQPISSIIITWLTVGPDLRRDRLELRHWMEVVGD